MKGKAMNTIPIEEAKSDLEGVLAKLQIGEGVYLTRDGQIVAYLSCEGKSPAGPRKLGGQPGSILYMAPDFDAPMDFMDSKE
jgi:antitoxin (DNA-binding transcriptional repressor) of toxin-antitoxin stability system